MKKRTTIIFILLFICTKIALPQIVKDFQVTDAINDSEPEDPKIAIGPDGSFIIAWDDHRREKEIGYYALEDVYAQRFNSNGVPQGKNFQVNDDVGIYEHCSPDVVIGPEGQSLIVWMDERNGQADIYAQRYDESGNKIGVNFQVNDDESLKDQWLPAIAMDSQGQSIAVWFDERNGNQEIFGQKFNPSGEKEGNNFRVSDNRNTRKDWPSIAANTKGLFGVIWQEEKDDSLSIRIQFYNLNAERIGNNRIITDTLLIHTYLPQIGINEDGSYLVIGAGKRERDPDETDIYGQFYNQDGEEILKKFIVNYISSYSVRAQSLSLAPEGHFVVVWGDNLGNTYRRDVFGQRFDKFANRIGGNFRINNDLTDKYQGEPDVVLSNDFAYYTWYDCRLGDSHVFACVDFFPAPATSVKQTSSIITKHFELSSNYPNPFNPQTTIPLSVREKSWLSLTIYDVLGRSINNIYEGIIEPGNHNFLWDGTNNLGKSVPAGIYFCRLVNQEGIQATQKMLLIK